MINRYKKIIDLVQFMKQEKYGMKEIEISTVEKPMLERIVGLDIGPQKTITLKVNPLLTLYKIIIKEHLTAI